ncbi:MAG: histidinol-phosphatase [Spirochaetaceae bacterium]|jgi:histidinol-phosphatase (PHP family)|nr:histidinol-phosphatase [Spirochaetaceae bacterium]
MKTNYHTHTVFCDGHDTAEDMVRAAVSKGFDVLGFSAHSLYPFAASWHLAPGRHGEYVAEIRRLQRAYAGEIKILLGFEADYLPPLALPDIRRYEQFHPDYLIGAVHYVTTAEGIFTVDGPADEVAWGVANLFGDGRRAVEAYFRQERDMLSRGGFDILAHPDVVRKRNGVLHFFDENDDWYLREIDATARAASQAGVIVEINTGGIARGALDDVYPSRRFLKALHQYGVPVIISSDAHRTSHLDVAFDLALERAQEAGWKAPLEQLPEKRCPWER